MRYINKRSVGCALGVFLACGLILVYPPYRTYIPDTVVYSVIKEVIDPAFPSGTAPEIEWSNGARNLWRDDFPYISFYGVENPDIQNLILASLKKHLAETDLPGLQIGFFGKRLSSEHLPKQLRRAVVER